MDATLLHNKRKDSNSSSNFSSASSVTGGLLPPLYHSVQKARISATAPRVLGGGTDPLFGGRFGSLTSDPRHTISTFRHNFEKLTNIGFSFDPATMHCTTCEAEHSILFRAGSSDLAGAAPKCFVLADQCFPPALPTSGEGDCLAITRIENGNLNELVGAFLGLASGYDIPYGTVVVISSLSHLSRVGTAAYAEDMVRSVARFKEAYGGAVRVVHGFPVIAGGLDDQSAIRALLEIDLWLGDIDRRRTNSLAETSTFFVKEYYTPSHGTSTDISTKSTMTLTLTASASTGLKLPTSLHSLDKAIFTSPGWEEMATSLPPLSEEEEFAVISVMLEELNAKFALQLDPSPSTERSGFDSPPPDTDSKDTLVLAGSSHAGRLAEAMMSTHLRVVDVSMPGFRVSENSVDSLVTDLEEAMIGLDDASTAVLLQPFDNSIFFSSKAQGEKVLTRRGPDGRFHVEGELKMISREDMKDMFSSITPLIKACKGKKVIVMGPMPRYLFSRCCQARGHLTNFDSTVYVAEQRDSIMNVYTWLKNIIFMRRLKNVKIFNPSEALGLGKNLGDDTDAEALMDLWGSDPVHPTERAYTILAGAVTTMADELIAEGAEPAPPTASKSMKRPAAREPWLAASEPVAKRLNERGHPYPRVGSRGNNRASRGAQPYGRGGQRGRGFGSERSGRGRWHRGGQSRGRGYGN